jgi:hypothetical protein
VVGVTNVFAGRGSWWPLSSCLAFAQEFWPELPIVGYDEDKKGRLLQRLGFREIGVLRVWGFVEELH